MNNNNYDTQLQNGIPVIAGTPVVRNEENVLNDIAKNNKLTSDEIELSEITGPEINKPIQQSQQQPQQSQKIEENPNKNTQTTQSKTKECKPYYVITLIIIVITIILFHPSLDSKVGKYLPGLGTTPGIFIRSVIIGFIYLGSHKSYDHFFINQK